MITYIKDIHVNMCLNTISMDNVFDTNKEITMFAYKMSCAYFCYTFNVQEPLFIVGRDLDRREDYSSIR